MTSGTIFVVCVAFAVFLLTLHEIRRYALAKKNPASFPYPRRRLARRIGIGILVIAVLFLIQFRPVEHGPWIEVVWLGFCALIVAVILLLTLRDLHETSVSVVGEHQRFHHEAEQRIRSVIQSELKPRDKTPGSR